jgi:regulator of sigma E protease
MHSWNDILENLTFEDMGKEKIIQVQRGDETIKLNASGKEILLTLADKKDLGLEPPHQKVYFQNVETIKPAGIAGLKKSDTVIAINCETVSGVIQFSSTIKANKEKPLTLTIKRNNEFQNINVTPNSDGIIGVMLGSIYQGPIEHVRYNIFESIGLGFTQTVNSVGLFFGSIAQIFNGTLTFKESVGGPIMIAQQASQQASMGLMSFLNFIALLSVSLAIINVLPLPALDGGHLIFILIESITRKEVSPKIKIAVQQSGVVLLMILMIFVIFNDLTR